MNIILCGLPGSGKSTVGKLLAEQFNRPFLDTDAIVEQLYLVLTQQQMTCRQISAKEGESYFRDLEHNVLSLLVTDMCCGHLIATGGGILQHPGNLPLMQKLGDIFYLKSNPSINLGRILRNGMPSYLDSSDPEKSFQQLASVRCPQYESASRFTIDTEGLTPHQVAQIIAGKSQTVLTASLS